MPDAYAMPFAAIFFMSMLHFADRLRCTMILMIITP